MGEIKSRTNYVNRELSWLEFNRRVLSEASNKDNPLFERLKFLAIYFNNLDEFFMVRIGSFHDSILLKSEKLDDKTGMNYTEQVDAVFKKVASFQKIIKNVYKELTDDLKNYDINLVDISKASKKVLNDVSVYFNQELMPLASPIIVDSSHPLPFINNLDSFVVCHITNKERKYLGIVTFSNLPKYFKLDIEGKHYIFSTAQVFLYFADKFFKKHKITNKYLMRITRNAEITPEEAMLEGDLDFKGIMTDLLKKRKKKSIIRAQLSKRPNKDDLALLLNHFKLTTFAMQYEELPFEFSLGFNIKKLFKEDYSSLCYQEIKPELKLEIAKEDLIDYHLNYDVLYAYPWNSFKNFSDLLSAAAIDPRVLTIKITLYRLANPSKIIAALSQAAENGKQVLCIVELRARFDEESNINYVDYLTNAGCQVIYGLDEYKIHSKLCLIQIKTSKGLRFITQIGTGNYNEKTSELYTDLSYVTNDKDIANDANDLFNELLVGNLAESNQLLWIAPNSFRSNLMAKIKEQMELEKDGYIFIKSNSLNDKEIIDLLFEASCRGVKIDLVIRGICCLIPHIPGVSENITVKSLVGRYLEHSRIYIFGVEGNKGIYIGSGDLLNRNTQRRVEVFTPILDQKSKEQILMSVDLLLQDTTNSWCLRSNGTYHKQKDVAEVNYQIGMHSLIKAFKTTVTKKPGESNFLGNIKKIFK